MKLLISEKEFASSRSRSKIPLECEECKTTFLASKNQVQVAIKGAGSHTLQFCSRHCANLAAVNRFNVPVITCNWCGTKVKRPPSWVAKHSLQFCSRSCTMRYNNKHKRTNPSNRSAAEDYLVSLISSDFPNLAIEKNARSIIPSGREVDIFIRPLNLAIELNGPIHYIPIFGDEKLKKTQHSDTVKQIELHSLSIRLIVVNISKCRHKKQAERFLDVYYHSHIKTILLELGALE